MFIPDKLPHFNYKIDVNIRDIEETICRYDEQQQQFGYKLFLESEFQRGHVWTLDQQQKYIEWILKGGEPGLIVFNHPEFQRSYAADMYLVDGLQRLTAIRLFMAGEITAYGRYVGEFSSSVFFDIFIKIGVGTVSYVDMLKWYISMNEGSTPHTKTEIDKVKKLLDEYS